MSLKRRVLRLALWGVSSLLLLSVLWFGWQFYADSFYHGERGPYLQMQAPDAITLRWQSSESERGVVHFGTSPSQLEHSVAESGQGTVHEVRLSGLQPDTRYYYAVGSSQHIHIGGTPDYWFMTAPLPRSERPVRIWVQGDPGLALPTTLAGRDAVLGWVNEHPRPGLPPIDLWLTTGDNAYRFGRNSEFQQNLFEPYAGLLRNVPYWPAFGNHDSRRWAFHNIFSFPENGESGGVPSGNEHFFSFDYGPVHFVFLDSHDSDRSVDGEMLRWLKRDLAATNQPWLIAVFHHPPYSKGSHDSDNPRDSGGRMQDMRENALPLLEAAGVDLVLSGHSHVYERSYLMGCHYGASDTLTPSMIVDQGMGWEPPYRKPAGLTPYGGTIYNVVGSSAYADIGPMNHPAKAVSLRELGSLLLDINGPTLTGRFINPQGKVLDSYRIVKGASHSGDGALPTVTRGCRSPAIP